MPVYHVAQVNIGQVRAPIEDALMAGFVARLDEINALAESQPRIRLAAANTRGQCNLFPTLP